MGDLSVFERGQVVGARLAGAPVTKTATVLGVSRVTFEDNVSEEEQWGKINIDRKRSSYIEKDCFEKSQNYCSTGELQQN
jgi:hypothetical protein